MFCPMCGQQIPDDSSFCPVCGNDLRLDAPANPSPVAQEPAYQQPAAQEPAYQQPVYEQPAYQTPVAPVYQSAYPDPVIPPYEDPQPPYEPKAEEPLYTTGAAGRPSYQQPNPPQQPYGYQQPYGQGGYQQPGYQQPGYQQPSYAPVYTAQPMAFAGYGAQPRPMIQLPTGRGLLKMIFLGLITLGIYPTVIYSRIVQEINIVASRHDGKRTMSYFGSMMLAPLTLMIYAIVWQHKLCNRIGDELKRRGIAYKFSAATMWLWGVLGSLIIVGPFIYVHKFMKSMNLINADFNEKG